mgnify:FL=1
MCIIASIPKNTGTINKDTLETMTNNNGHGFGVSYIDNNNNIVTFKTMDDKEFVSKVMQIQKDWSKNSDILIHARIATSGKTNKANCHPFQVTKDTVFAHNGVLTCVEPTKNMSDTRVFNEVVLKNLKGNFLNNKGIVEFLEEIIGSDKMVFLTTNPAYKSNTIILNQEFGEEVDGIWFSNNSYKAKNYVSSYNWWDENDGYCQVVTNNPSEVEEFIPADLVEIVGEFGSIADYYDQFGDRRHKDKLNEIFKELKEPKESIILKNGNKIVDSKKLFKANDYDTDYLISDELKQLLKKMYSEFGIHISVANYTTKDWNSAMWDCFGHDLPVQISQTKNRKLNLQ